MAYRMLGSAMEADDIVQDEYLRYRATPPESIRSLKSLLSTIVHHLCMDHLKSAQARRETYVGPWLPEPIITGDGASLHPPLRQMTDPDSISMAFLVLLESLSPLERAVFLLREVFDYEYTEIAEITGRDEAACRQLFSRGKSTSENIVALSRLAGNSRENGWSFHGSLRCRRYARPDESAGRGCDSLVR